MFTKIKSIEGCNRSNKRLRMQKNFPKQGQVMYPSFMDLLEDTSPLLHLMDIFSCCISFNMLYRYIILKQV